MRPVTVSRYAPPTWEELNHLELRKTCADCAYCKEISKSQNGLTEYFSACVFEVYQADTFDKLSTADIVHVEPDEEACTDFKEA